MAYEFKRLAEVEELTEVPENAQALVEVDGAVKRAPMAKGGGGNANLEEMIFDLDIDYTTGNNVYLANMDKVTKALNNNMTIHLVRTTDPSGIRYIHDDYFACIRDTLAFSEASGVVTGQAHISNVGDIYISCDAEDYGNGILTATQARIYFINVDGYTLVRIYASIF